MSIQENTIEFYKKHGVDLDEAKVGECIKSLGHDKDLGWSAHNEKFEWIKQVPSYFEAKLDGAIAKINEAEKSITDGGMFIFATDVHLYENQMSAVPLMKEIGEKTSVDKVFNGGDIPWAFGTKEKCLTESYIALELMSEVKENMRFYIARGNHDFTIKGGWEDDTGYTLPYKATRDILMSYQSNDAIVPDEEALYFYVDDEKEKIRYIVLDTCSRDHAPEEQYWGVKYKFDDEQAEWLANEALQINKGSDWSVIVIGHISCVPGVSSYSNALDEVAQILKDFKNKRKSAKWDFTSAKEEFVAYICGHNHQDRHSVEDNTLFISTGSTSALWDDCWDRALGTTDEELFDIFVIDKTNKTLKAIRVGAGEDREFNY